jgi:APA family basic amino acid/polyamine antiporter
MASPHLQRKLGLWPCISIVIGSVIGSSIFMKPATMASQLGSPWLLLSVWVVAGIISIFGGMINSEVGTMIPETGGQYTYFRIMYGEFFAFILGWAAFIVINTAGIASIAFIFAQYFNYLIHLPSFSTSVEHSVFLHIPFIGSIFPLENFGVKMLAILCIVVMTVINHFSLKAGGAVQVLFTALKVASLIFLVSTIFLSGKGSIHNFTANSSKMDFSLWSVITGFIAATSGALAAYDGWNNLGSAGGEIINPQKNIPRGLIGGLIVCMILYILTTQAYLYMLPLDEMSNSKLVATDALSKVIGGKGSIVIALLVVISAAGAVNGNVFPGARITYAMAKDKLFFSVAGRVDKKYHTPTVALWIQCIWSSLFVISGSFDMLTDMFVFVTWLFYGFAAYGIIVLRKKMPNADRPYKLKAYPYIPIIFILFTIIYFFITIYNDIHSYIMGKSHLIYSALGLLLLSLGIPFYLYFRYTKKYMSIKP